MRMYRLGLMGLFASAVVACSGSGLEAGDSASGQGDGASTVATRQALVLHPLGAKPDSSSLIASKQLASAPPTAPLPTYVDLSGQAPPVGNQGAQGSCVGWATAYAAKSIEEVAEVGWSDQSSRYQFSPSWIYNQINGGVDGGSYPSDALNLLVNSGADTLKFFPYSDSNFTNQPDASSVARASRFKSQSWGTLSGVTAIKQVLAAGRPVMVAFQVLPDWDRLDATNPVYDSSDTTDYDSRGGHMVAVVGYDDAMGAFRVINSWGTGWGLSGYGWIAYSFITDSKLALSAYSLTDAPNSAPPSGNSLYMVQGGNLWRIDNDFGDWSRVSSASDWVGTQSFTNFNGKLYMIQDDTLWKTDPATGAYTPLGVPAWAGPSAMTAWGSTLYIIQDGTLYKITDLTSGDYKRVSSVNAFPGSLLLTSLGSYLYVVKDGSLYQVSPTTGTPTRIGAPGDFANATAITAANGLLYIATNTLKVVDNLSTGHWYPLGTENWAGTTSMSSVTGMIYINRNGWIVEVDPLTGASEQLNKAAWAGPVSLMTAIQ